MIYTFSLSLSPHFFLYLYFYPLYICKRKQFTLSPSFLPSSISPLSLRTEIVLNGHGFRILRKRVLSKSEKLSRMSEQCEILCSLGSEASTGVFEKRMQVLKYLERVWESNQDEKLNEVIDMDMELN
uniref:Uncharacterized protein n=1 Tax=Cacopsylla melanoneura TaxID=428564 RepID=A0A8D8LLB0_9HEMI